MTAAEGHSPAGVFATLRATPAPVRYLLAGVLVNYLGAFMQTFLVLYLSVRGFSLGHAGAALTAYSVGAVGGTLIGGELTHRVGPRTTIVAAMTASALVVGSVPWLSRPGLFGVLLLAVALAGLVTQAYRPAAAVMLSDLMPEEHRVMAFSMMRIAMNIGAAVGPLIAAGLILIDWNLLYWVDAATALAYAALAFTLLPDLPAPQEVAEPGQPAEDKRSGYAALLRDTRYLLFLASVLIGSTIYVQYIVALPLKITAEGHPTALYSAVLATSSLTLILCELKITTYVRHWPSYVPSAIGSALVGFGLAGYGLTTTSAAVIILSTIVFVFGVMISGPTMFAHPAKFPAAVKARYIGAQQAMFGLGSALGPVLGVLAWGALANGIWLACGVLGVIAALCALVGMREAGPAPRAVAAADGRGAAGRGADGRGADGASPGVAAGGGRSGPVVLPAGEES